MPEPLPLDGVRVVALAETVPAPLASGILADLGASVLVIERPGGDPARGVPAVFTAFGRNKAFLALDLRDESHRVRFDAECARADAILVGYRPDLARRLGVDPASLRERFPDTVVVSVTAHGDDEPEPVSPAHDLSVRASAGLLPTTRVMTEEELDAAPVADVATGAYGAIAVLAGLTARARGQRAPVLAVSMQDAARALNAIELTTVLSGLGEAGAMRAPAGYRTFRCADGGLLALGVSYEMHHWRTLCAELQLDDIAALDIAERIEDRVGLNARIADALVRLTLDGAIARLRATGLPVQEVRDAPAVAGSPDFCDMVVGDPSGGRHVASPIVVDGRRLPVYRSAPAFRQTV